MMEGIVNSKRWKLTGLAELMTKSSNCLKSEQLKSN